MVVLAKGKNGGGIWPITKAAKQGVVITESFSLYAVEFP
jgi:hypothetical protein